VQKFKNALACLKQEKVWVFPFVVWAMTPRYPIDVEGPCMATHSLPIDYAELGASLLAALQVYGRPMTEEQRTKGYTRRQRWVIGAIGCGVAASALWVKLSR
jgi:hypothetical protein